MNLLTTHRKSGDGLSTAFEKDVENKRPPPAKGSGASTPSGRRSRRLVQYAAFPCRPFHERSKKASAACRSVKPWKYSASDRRSSSVKPFSAASSASRNSLSATRFHQPASGRRLCQSRPPLAGQGSVRLRCAVHALHAGCL